MDKFSQAHMRSLEYLIPGHSPGATKYIDKEMHICILFNCEERSYYFWTPIADAIEHDNYDLEAIGTMIEVFEMALKERVEPGDNNNSPYERSRFRCNGERSTLAAWHEAYSQKLAEAAIFHANMSQSLLHNTFQR